MYTTTAWKNSARTRKKKVSYWFCPWTVQKLHVGLFFSPFRMWKTAKATVCDVRRFGKPRGLFFWTFLVLFVADGNSGFIRMNVVSAQKSNVILPNKKKVSRNTKESSRWGPSTQWLYRSNKCFYYRHGFLFFCNARNFSV